MERKEYDRLSRVILDSCIVVHKEMGPGLLESVYEACLMKELELRGVQASNQVPIPRVYKGVELSKDFRIDVLVEHEIIVEGKSSEQMISLRSSNNFLSSIGKKEARVSCKFQRSSFETGFKRLVNNF